jgi:hypothetical protein
VEVAGEWSHLSESGELVKNASEKGREWLTQRRESLVKRNGFEDGDRKVNGV